MGIHKGSSRAVMLCRARRGCADPKVAAPEAHVVCKSSSLAQRQLKSASLAGVDRESQSLIQADRIDLRGSGSGFQRAEREIDVMLCNKYTLYTTP